MFDDTYISIAAPAEGLFRDRGSKFLAFVFPVHDEKQIQQHLEELRRIHPSANHHCYAWRLGFDKQRYRFNDDGEPSGTAGRPIFGQLQALDLTNVLIVVVRYFGGTLLGVGGLVQAYKAAAADALKNSNCIVCHITEIYEIQFAYDKMNEVMRLLKAKQAGNLKLDTQEICRIEFAIRKANADGLIDALKKIDGLTLKWLQTV